MLKRNAAAVLAGTVALMSVMAVEAKATIKLGSIMPLGDSITYGYGSPSTPGGYRSPLYTDLTGAGYSLNYVGSQTGNPDSVLTAANQTAHEGHSGYAITSISSDHPGITENLSTYIGPSVVQPNYILLMIGTNDVGADTTAQASTQQQRLAALIENISNKKTGLDPNGHLIVSTIPMVLGSAASIAASQAYNVQVAADVAFAAGEGENVSLANAGGSVPAADMSDNLHPNAAGYAVLAQGWASAIEATVPEPTSLGLIGTVGLVLARRRNARRA